MQTLFDVSTQLEDLKWKYYLPTEAVSADSCRL